MDASNPVMTQDRVKLGDMAKHMGARRRQDLKFLADLAAGAPRTLFAGPPSILDPEANFKDFVSKVPKPQRVSLGLQGVDLSFLKSMPKIPVAPDQYLGMQIHPPAKNMAAGYVSANRTFEGDTSYDIAITRGAAAHFSSDVLVEAYNMYTHSAGTPTGFQKRLKELCTRECKSPYTRQEVASRLEKLIPINADLLPDWHDFSGLIKEIDITYSASAGAPYWKSKREAMHECLDYVLPVVCEAIEKGQLQQLYELKPEWFLCEVKNKLDRYETSKLQDKCRPYVNQPFHFSLLFSALLQPFTKALYTWEDHTTYNAYGMSAAHGGLMKLVSRVRKLHEKSRVDGKRRYLVGCYGDDGKILQISPEGVVGVDPDFRQMDGSVDRATVEGVTDYIYKMYSTKYGEQPFWRSVLDLMVNFATNPEFIIHGSEVYTKHSKDGILSGVVGTTLFDTAKAVIAYSELVAGFKNGTISLNNRTRITNLLRATHGLEVKEGTWSPAAFNLHGAPGDYVTDNKFLGVQWMFSEFAGNEIVVPVLPRKDWLHLMMSPRDPPGINEMRMSDFAKLRRSFDRARGYLITGAIFDEDVAQALWTTVDQIPGSAVLLSTDVGGGGGEVISENAVLTSGVTYPTSSCVPNLEWVQSLYSDLPTTTPPEVYPTLRDTCLKIKVDWKLNRVANVPIVMVEQEQGPPKPALDFTKAKPPALPPIDFDIGPSESNPRTLKPRDKESTRFRLQDVAEYKSNTVGFLYEGEDLTPEELAEFARNNRAKAPALDAMAKHVQAVLKDATRGLPFNVQSSPFRSRHHGPPLDVLASDARAYVDRIPYDVFLTLHMKPYDETQNPKSYLHALCVAQGWRLSRVRRKEELASGRMSHAISLLFNLDPTNPFSSPIVVAEATSVISSQVAYFEAVTTLLGAMRTRAGALGLEVPKPPNTASTMGAGKSNPFYSQAVNVPRREMFIPQIPYDPPIEDLNRVSWSRHVELEQLAQQPPRMPTLNEMNDIQKSVLQSHSTAFEIQRAPQKNYIVPRQPEQITKLLNEQVQTQYNPVTQQYYRVGAPGQGSAKTKAKARNKKRAQEKRRANIGSSAAEPAGQLLSSNEGVRQVSSYRGCVQASGHLYSC